MTLSLDILAARMRQGESIPLGDTARVAVALSVPAILQQLVVTAMEYIDAAMVGHIGAEATAAIGIVSSSTWLLHGILVGLFTSFAIQIAQYLGADRQEDARGVLRQSMIFNILLGCGMAALGIGICRFLPGWLGAAPSLQGNASAYFGIWSAALPFSMAMGMYSAMLRATGDALTPSLISVLVCVLDIFFNFFLINPTREMELLGQTVTMFGFGWGVPGAALGTALATMIGGLAALAVLLLRESPLAIRYPGSWKITRSCLINLWRVGVPLAAERRPLLGSGASRPHRVPAGHCGHCGQQPGRKRRGPVLHGGLRHPGCFHRTGRAGRGCPPPGHVQAVCLALHRDGHGHHGSFRHLDVAVCPGTDEHFYGRRGCHCTRGPNAPH